MIMNSEVNQLEYVVRKGFFFMRPLDDFSQFLVHSLRSKMRKVRGKFAARGIVSLDLHEMLMCVSR